MYTKAKIYNLAAGLLLLTKEISDPDTDVSTPNRIFNIHYDVALRTTLQDLDLDGTSTQKTLELIEADPTDLWSFAYKYPTNCSFLRRLQSSVLKDNRTNQIPKRVANHDGVKVIFTDQEEAIAEYIAHDLPLSLLSAPAGLAVAYRLAILSPALIVGKGATALKKELNSQYLIVKANAQEHDRLENANFDEDEITSEFVEARLS